MSERPTTDDLRHVYRILLGREPDPAGRAHWTARLGDLTLDDLVWEFMESLEYRRRQFARLAHWRDFPKPTSPPPRLNPLASQLATQAQVDSPTYWRWCEELREPPRHHRKQWEFVFLLQALDETGMLRPGTRGLGFGVGREPIASVLAARGCDIVVTDLDPIAAEHRGWRTTHQHSSTVDELHQPEICDLEVFRRRVCFRVENMNAISDDLKTGQFDFVWSLCALEHLGSIRHGLRYIEESLRCLKPGGVAVHTTEYNVSSNTDTLEDGPTVLFRQRDIEQLAADVARSGCRMDLNLHPGDGPLDRHYDVPPYHSGAPLKLALDRYIATSIGLLIRTPETPR